MYTFENIKGNNLIIKGLQNAIKYNKVSHSYIFNGDHGMGKKTLAKTFAKTLLCEKGGINPCNECISCKTFETNNNPDIIYVKSDNSSIGTSLVKEQINNVIQIKPYKYKYKIIIIDNADTMTVSAQNAILKTIEEPPFYGVFLFLVNNINNLLPTILSRCVTYNLTYIKDDYLKDYLIHNTDINKDLLDFYCAYSNGNIGHALQLLNDKEFINMRNTTINMISNLDNWGVEDIYKNIKILEQYKDNIDQILDIIILWYRDVIMFKINNRESIYQRDKLELLKISALNLSLTKLILRIDEVAKAKHNLSINANFQLNMEVMFLKLRKI